MNTTNEAGKPVFIHGPQGCGKTRNADALCKHYGKSAAIEHEPGASLAGYPAHLLVLCTEPVDGSIEYTDAARAARIEMSTQTEAEATKPAVKYCKDCAFIQGANSVFPRCSAPGVGELDYVFGLGTHTCKDARATMTLCGPTATHFQPRTRTPLRTPL